MRIVSRLLVLVLFTALLLAFVQLAQVEFTAPAYAQETTQSADGAKPADEPVKDIQLKRDIVFGNGGDQQLMLNLAYDANQKGKRPCVVVIHGGAWRMGNRGGLHDMVIEGFARRGYVAASISYRLCPEHIFPAQIEDAKCAVRYLRAHAEQYNIDIERIGAMGYSAGAHLAMLLGTMDKEDGLEGEGGWAEQSSKVQTVVSFFGPTDLSADDIPRKSVPLLQDFLGGPRETRRELVKAASPVTYLDERDGPMLLFHGTKDHLIPATQAWIMANRMTESGVDGRVELVIGADHGWFNWESIRTLEQMYVFFDQHLK